MTRDYSKELDLLISLGLSTGESKVYLELLAEPQGEMLERVVTAFGIPTPIAEDALKSLSDKGLVKVSSNRVEVLQPRLVLQRILDQRKRILEDELSRQTTTALDLEKLLEPVYWENRLGIRPEDIIEPLRDLPDMEVRTARMLEGATREVSIFAETFGWYEKVREAIFQAHDRRVAMKVLMMVKDPSTAQRAKELGALGIQVRHCAEEWYPVRGTLVDDQELVFVVWATKKSEIPRPIYFRPNYTKNQGLIRIFRDAFQKRWEEAQSI
ncbi:MAG TPA: helix-turn-helix domain-containing protein [Candidatus Dormibacteraeota bacterium]|nr:helix-turn-helix domain-containing protein [Candidatus Dormibacteraeota bacterium]